MVLPEEIGDAAQDAADDDVARIKAWLDGGGDVNDGDKDGYTLIHCCAIGDQDCSEIHDGHVSLARTLIALGADVREFLALRGLAQRGKLAVQIGTYGSRGHSALEFLARLGDNGVCWHILTYWRATD